MIADRFVIPAFLMAGFFDETSLFFAGPIFEVMLIPRSFVRLLSSSSSLLDIVTSCPAETSRISNPIFAAFFANRT